MIKIPTKIWYIIKPEKDSLAYMCPYETNKDGEPLSNISKMMETGKDWATVHEYDYANRKNLPPIFGEEFITENTPTKGFYIGDSVSRWSTSNKLFRVKDPRGFTVEVPTGNIATLLHHTTVTNGIVQDKCVWGRDGNNHILLPVNSEPYLETLDKMDTLANKLISKKDLKIGDWVKFFEDEREYCYIGKIKVTWKIRQYQKSTYDYRTRSYSGKKLYQEVVYEEEKWRDVFIYKGEYWFGITDKYYTKETSNPKIVEVLRNELVNYNKDNLVLNVKGYKIDYSYNYEFEIMDIKVKVGDHK